MILPFLVVMYHWEYRLGVPDGCGPVTYVYIYICFHTLRNH